MLDIDTSVFSKEDALTNNFMDLDNAEGDFDILCDEISTLMKKVQKGTSWHGYVRNFGWLKKNGEKQFTASNGAELLRQVLPQCECTFYVWFFNQNGIKGIAINNYHHDSPTGDEWYFITKGEWYG